jgi:hypothetical protein
MSADILLENLSTWFLIYFIKYVLDQGTFEMELQFNQISIFIT